MKFDCWKYHWIFRPHHSTTYLSTVICTKTAEPIEMPFGLWARMSQRKHILYGAQIPHVKEQLLGKRHARACPTILPWTVQKLLNRSICHLGCGLGWAELSTSSIVFVRLRQPMCPHRRAHWQPGECDWRLNRPYAAAMRPYVKLLWPLVTYYHQSVLCET